MCLKNFEIKSDSFFILIIAGSKTFTKPRISVVNVKIPVRASERLSDDSIPNFVETSNKV